MDNSLKGILSLIVSRITAGLNVNCTKYLIPLWIAPMGLVSLRVFFGCIFFWLLAIFDKPDTSSFADKVKLFLLGAVAVFGYMSLAALAISYTTPVNFVIFNATQPLWVFMLSVFAGREKVTFVKVAGIVLGFAGVVATAFSGSAASIASHPLLGNTLAMCGALVYAVYLITAASLLKRVSNLVMLRYTFLGAAMSAAIALAFNGFEAPLFTAQVGWKVIAVLVFILLFPTVLSYILIPIGIKYLKATLVAVYGYVTLFVATVVSLVLGQDRFDAMLAAALLLICVGIFMVNVAERGDIS